MIYEKCFKLTVISFVSFVFLLSVTTKYYSINIEALTRHLHDNEKEAQCLRICSDGLLNPQISLFWDLSGQEDTFENHKMVLQITFFTILRWKP